MAWILVPLSVDRHSTLHNTYESLFIAYGNGSKVTLSCIRPIEFQWFRGV